ncbi:MAG: CpsB/CapC family capsule biosynthesis tyrosine phosphatase [Candidatus Ornithospirochaeta sp.]
MDEGRRRARIIDFHSHVLPCIDDGSKNKEMSRNIMAETHRQKVRKMVATPHFYPDSMSLSSFLSDRERSAKLLLSVWNKETCPRIFLGAEVAYFQGIGESENLERLTIVGTNTLLLEMPYSVWSERMIDEVVSIKYGQGLDVVLAHVERCLSFQEKGTLDYLLSRGIYTQCNASFFLDVDRQEKALDMLGRGKIHILGSDTHNTTSRRQRIGEAGDLIRERIGNDIVEKMLGYSRLLLSGAVSIDQM